MSITLDFLDSVQLFIDSILLYIKDTLIPFVLLLYELYFTNNYTILISVVIPISYWLYRVYKSQKHYRSIWSTGIKKYQYQRLHLVGYVLVECVLFVIIQVVVLLVLLGVFFLIAGWFCIDYIVECDKSVLENDRFYELYYSLTSIFYNNPFRFR